MKTVRVELKFLAWTKKRPLQINVPSDVKPKFRVRAAVEHALKVKADLKGVDLSGQELTRCHLEGANLQGADLSLANLYHAYLQGADLQQANLRQAKLLEADMDGCNFFGANVSRTIIIKKRDARFF